MRKSIICISMLLSLVFFGADRTWAQDFYKQTIKFGRFLDYLERFYYDSVDADKIVEQAIISQLQELDPHSTYISSDDVKKMNEPLEGNFEGIGISFYILNDTLFVIAPIPGGPSEKLGILAGDRIIKVDGKNIAGIGLTNEDVFSMLRGTKGTKVTVTIVRKHVSELLDFTIIRDKIPINSIDAAYMADPTTGYIKLNRFSMTTMQEFTESTTKLKTKGAENMILDLTGNSGGYLDVAVKLADEFLDNRKLIVYTQGLHSPRTDYFADAPGVCEKGKLIILIDEGSASASEIVSGAIQDWDRGIIIGRRSFGKGLVQRPLELPDASIIRLTVANYYTPSGRLIQKPFNEGQDNYENEIFKRYQHGEFVSKDSIHFPDSLRYKTLVKKRTVFGGGGIMPDVFIPMDTSFYSDYYRDLIRKGVLNQFVLSYIDKNRKKLQNSYPDFQSYKNTFVITDAILIELAEYGEQNDLKKNQEDFNRSKAQISNTLKAYIARDLWTTSEFYEIINETDDKYIKAVDILKNWDESVAKILQ